MRHVRRRDRPRLTPSLPVVGEEKGRFVLVSPICSVSRPLSAGAIPMKAYLITTGVLFGLLALAHALRTIAEWSRLVEDPWFLVESPGIGILAAALCVWACRLLRASPRP